MNIYVGNLPHDTTEQELKSAFESFGQVLYAKIIKDRDTGQPRGFGFVEMPDETAAHGAIADMNGKQFKGRNLRVNVGRPKDPSADGGGNRGNSSDRHDHDSHEGFGTPRREPR